MYIVNCHQFPLFKVSISTMDCKLPSSDGVDSCTKSGRPSYKNKPYGMSDTEYSDLVTFLDSPQSNPVYPIGMRATVQPSGSCPKKDKYCKKKRQRFRAKCSKFTDCYMVKTMEHY